MQKTNTKDMTSGNPAKLLLFFAVPLMLGNLFQQMYTMVDTIIVGKGVGVEALASLGAADWLNWLFLGLVTGLTQGFSIQMAQLYGAGQKERLKQTIGNAVFLTAAAAVLLPYAETACDGPASAAPSRATTDAGPLVGMTDTAAYFPLLRGRRVAVLANHTSVALRSELGDAAHASAATSAATPAASSQQLAMTPAGEGWVHLVDLLHECGFDLRAIFSPEHGFRGEADAGAHVQSSVDARTGVPIRSLYDGRTQRPSDEAMRSFDVLVVDLQDVGLRFYT